MHRKIDTSESLADLIGSKVTFKLFVSSQCMKWYPSCPARTLAPSAVS